MIYCEHHQFRVQYSFVGEFYHWATAGEKGEGIKHRRFLLFIFFTAGWPLKPSTTELMSTSFFVGFFFFFFSHFYDCMTQWRRKKNERWGPRLIFLQQGEKEEKKTDKNVSFYVLGSSFPPNYPPRTEPIGNKPNLEALDYQRRSNATSFSPLPFPASFPPSSKERNSLPLSLSHLPQSILRCDSPAPEKLPL